MKKKIALNELMVRSFVTDLRDRQTQTVKGGVPDSTACQDEPSGYDTCQVSCVATVWQNQCRIEDPIDRLFTNRPISICAE